MRHIQRGRSFARMSVVLIFAILAVGLVLVALDTGKGKASSQTIVSLGDTLTPTHFVYLPFVFNERLCTDPPSGTVMIAGQATVHGRPAQPGVPFILSYGTWEWPAYPIMTMTTRNNGSFCFGPVRVLDYCYAVYYRVDFHYAEGMMPKDDYVLSWSSNLLRACKSGMVYTVSAEIGKTSE